MNVAAYILLFTAVGVGFILVHLIAGKIIRPNKPGVEKGTIYECGEPTIGSAWVQFDLRFYVVALLFVIFDVEVAFFFPWAEVFGRANDVAALEKPTDAASYRDYCQKVLALAPAHFATRAPVRSAYERLAHMKDKDLGQFDALKGDQVVLTDEQIALKDNRTLVDEDWGANANEPRPVEVLAWTAFFDILVFFGVLLVGFAYLWHRGDLAWVRSISDRAVRPPPPMAPPSPRATEQVLTTGSPT
jgi:NADH-quinone oxidoreductase subunit A